MWHNGIYILNLKQRFLNYFIIKLMTMKFSCNMDIKTSFAKCAFLNHLGFLQEINYVFISRHQRSIYFLPSHFYALFLILFMIQCMSDRVGHTERRRPHPGAASARSKYLSQSPAPRAEGPETIFFLYKILMAYRTGYESYKTSTFICTIPYKVFQVFSQRIIYN